MKFHFKQNDGTKVVFKFEEDVKDSLFFEGKEGEILPELNENKILVGLGKKDDFSIDILKNNVYKLGKFLAKKNVKDLNFSFENISDIEEEKLVKIVVEAIYMSSYSFDYYKSEKDNFNLENIYFDLDIDMTDEVEEFINVLESQNFTRNIVNMRANDIYPETLAKAAVEELGKYGVDVKVYNKEEIEELGLKAFLEVARGSEREPRFIVMEYMKGNDEKPLAFVGKGLTYDSGGYSIKPTNGMFTMNSDMGGSGTVIGAIRAIAKNNLKVNVVGVVAACENMISGKAYKPGDIIDSLSGKKIEIDNTDAEGRVTLADAVYYTADNYNPEVLIDLATLTGACLVALGERYTGIVTNSEEAYEKLEEAAKEASEKIWKFPNDPDFKELFKSENADLLNSGSRFAGTITAGQFIGEFNKDVDWIHMDIAGTAYYSKEYGLYQKGATGIHVKTLYNLAKNYSK